MSMFRDLLMEISSKKPRLPDEYQEVEWIGSSGNQYINTNINLTYNMNFEVEYATTGITNWATILGTDNLGVGRMFLGITSNSNIKEYYLYASSYNVTFNYNYAELNIKTKAVFTNKTNAYSIYLSNENGNYEYEIPKSQFSLTNYPIYLFALNRNGGATDKALARIYSAIIRNGETILGNFVPCYRKSDNVIGMYDLVSNNFFINQGSGTFTKGADVN